MTTPLALRPLESSPTLQDRIYRVLRDAIHEIDVYSSDANLRLDERTIAKQLGISRTPLREALIRLENEAVVEIKARKGIFVKRRGIAEVVELITVWAALESMAARLACSAASDEQISELRQIGTRYSPQDARLRINEYSKANIEFHRQVLKLSNCDMLENIGNELFMHLKPVRRHAMRDARRADRSVADHGNIVDAIAARKPNRAAKLVREHTLRLGDYIRQNWQHSMNAGC